MKNINSLIFSAAATCLSVVWASSCTQKAFEHASKKCVDGFFAKLKQNPKMDCGYEKISILLSNGNSTFTVPSS